MRSFRWAKQTPVWGIHEKSGYNFKAVESSNFSSCKQTQCTSLFNIAYRKEESVFT